MSSVHHPEKLVPGKYNIIAVGGDDAAILWKDGEYFAIGIVEPFLEPFRIDELTVDSFITKGQMVRPEPIPLDDLSEWRKKTREVNIPLLPIEKQ